MHIHSISIDMSHEITYHLERNAGALQELCLFQGRPSLKLLPDWTLLPQGPWDNNQKTTLISISATKGVTFILLISQLISCGDDWYRYVITAYLLNSLLDKFLHVFFTKVSCFWPAVPIKHSKVEEAVSQLWDLEAVFILLALADERGTAYPW